MIHTGGHTANTFSREKCGMEETDWKDVLRAFGARMEKHGAVVLEVYAPLRII
jgi:hypothetical protein